MTDSRKGGVEERSQLMKAKGESERQVTLEVSGNAPMRMSEGMKKNIE